ncbi:MAG: nitroreductase family deazaflavin-dependent oxidoreductase [Ilumatobacteraceae bacterium]
MTITSEPPVTPGPRYLEPDAFTRKVFNPILARLTRLGLSVRGSRVLTVVGRSSGQPRDTIVNLLELDGVRYLVAPRGRTQWVRNLRAAEVGTLRVGRKVEAFRAVELADADKPEVIRAYLAAWAWEVGKFFDGLTKDSSDADIAAVAPGFPVFRVEPR